MSVRSLFGTWKPGLREAWEQPGESGHVVAEPGAARLRADAIDRYARTCKSLRQIEAETMFSRSSGNRR